MRTTMVGVVTSDRNSKTRRVDVERLFQHTKYKKIVRGRTVCYVHDENNESKMGDTVEIVVCRPHSKTKRWELLKVVRSVDEVASQIARDEKAVQVAGEDSARLTTRPEVLTSSGDQHSAED